MTRLAELEQGRQITRRVGNLVIRVRQDGLFVRTYRRRRWRFVPWLKLDPPKRGPTEKEWSEPLVSLARY